MMTETANTGSFTGAELIVVLRERAAPLTMRQAEYVEHLLAIPADREGLEAAEVMIAAADRLEVSSDMLEALKAIKADPTIKSVMNSPLWHKLTSAIEKAEAAS